VLKKGQSAIVFAVKQKQRDLVQLFATSMLKDSLVDAESLTDACFKIKFSSDLEFEHWIVGHFG
jgi:hypothetical protein